MSHLGHLLGGSYSSAEMQLVYSTDQANSAEDKLWLFHHNKQPAHITQFLDKRNIAIQEQPPYSSDLALSDFFLFLELKGIIKRIHFEGMEAIKKVIKTKLRVSQKNPLSSAKKRGKIYGESA